MRGPRTSHSARANTAILPAIMPKFAEPLLYMPHIRPTMISTIARAHDKRHPQPRLTELDMVEDEVFRYLSPIDFEKQSEVA